jgi:hypothetical protein
MRMCRNYYTRLHLSGRWYTLMLALYNHFRSESATDCAAFLEQGLFTTTPGRKIALASRVVPTWENCTALLFMQLAASAWSALQRSNKQSHPLALFYPDFKGLSPLTTALPAHTPLPGPQTGSSKTSASPLSSELKPLEESSAWKRWQKIEKDQQIMAAELARRNLASRPTASSRSASPGAPDADERSP